MERKKIVLSIAGSDSGAGAGIQADIKAVAAVGGYCATAITAITAQNTVGVEAVYPLSGQMVRSQIDAVAKDMDIDVIKTGMLPTMEVIDEVCRAIERYNVEKVVVDPVMVATSGDSLVDDTQIDYLIKKIFPLATLLTPNIPEIEKITGVQMYNSESFDIASEIISRLGAKNLLIKGGHLESDRIEDRLYCFASDEKYLFLHPKIDTENTHGTGCSLASAIAGYLSQGNSLSQSVELAISYIQTAIIGAKGWKIGLGHSPIKHI